MMTSLQSQLRSLATPQTSIDFELKSRPSIIFEPKEAAKYDERTFYEIGLHGLLNLIKVDKQLDIFKSYFFEKYKNFDRSIATKQENDDLNKTIRDFFYHLSPYMLLVPSLEILEWLTFKFEIYKYNVDELIALILPYHTSKLFPQCLKVINLSANYCKQWIWLKRCRKSDQPLSKLTLYKHASRSISFLNFISEVVTIGVEEFDDNVNLSNLFKFYINCVFGALNRIDTISELQISSVLPVLLHSLNSNNIDLMAGSYMITGQILHKSSLKPKLLKKFLLKISSVPCTEMRLNSVRLMLILYDRQSHYKQLADSVLAKILQNDWFIECLSEIQKINCTISFLVRPLLSAMFRNIFGNGTNDCLDSCKVFVVEFLEKVHLNEYNVEIFIRSLLEQFNDNDELLVKWTCEIMNKIERKYCLIFDKIITNMENDKQKLSIIWSAMLNIDNSLDKTAFFLQLMNPNVKLRVHALENLLKNLSCLEQENLSFLKNSILTQFNDDNEDVIMILLKSFNRFSKLFSKRKLLDLLINLLRKFQSERNVVVNVVEVLVSQEFYEPEFRSEILYVVLPFLFPLNNESDLIVARNIQSSYLFSNWSELDLISEIKSSDYIAFQNNIIERFCFNDFISKLLLTSLKTNDLFSFESTQNTFLTMFLLVKKYEFQNDDKLIAEILDTILTKSKLCSKSIKVDIMGIDNDAFLNETLVYCQNIIPFSSYLKILDIILTTIDLSVMESTCMDLCQSTVLIKAEIIIKLLNWLMKKHEKKPNDQIVQVLDKFFNSKFDNKNKQVVFLLNVLMFKDNIMRAKYWEKLRNLIKNVSITDDVKLLLTLNMLSPNSNERALCMKCIDFFENSDDILLRIFRENRMEVQMDDVAIPLIISRNFHEKSSKKIGKDFIETYNYFLGLLQDQSVPVHILSKIVQLLSCLNSVKLFQVLLSVANDRFLTFQEEFQSNYYFNDISAFFDVLLCNINERNVARLNADKWAIFVKLLREQRFIEIDNTTESVSNSLLKKMNASIFKAIGFENQIDFFNEILNILVDRNSNTAKKFIKMIEIDSSFITDYFMEKNINISKDFLNGLYWQRVILVLELIQGRKDLKNGSKLLINLLMLLQKCLLFEEQNLVEYGKQLVLNVIGDLIPTIEVSDLEKIFNLDLIIQCFHASDNLQSHQHAMIVLREISKYLPTQVLHNIVSIFTFIGSSTARKEDEYSFNLVTNILETILPILNNSNEHKSIVLAVLRVFADVILDVPQHRRLRLYEILLNTFGCGTYLWIFVLLVSEAQIRNADKEKQSKHKLKRIEFLLELIDNFEATLIFKMTYKLSLYLNNVINKYKHGQKIEYDPVFETFNTANYSIAQFNDFQSLLGQIITKTLSSDKLLRKIAVLDAKEEETIFEPVYKNLLVQVLFYVQKLNNHLLKTKKDDAIWLNSLLENSYEILRKINEFLNKKMFLLVINGLLDHSIISIRQKSLEFLNTKLEFVIFDDQDLPDLVTVLDKVLIIVDNLNNPDNKGNTDMEQYEQTAMITLKLLTKLLIKNNLNKFETILCNLIKLLENGHVTGHLLSSTLLAVVEIILNLKLRSLNSTTVFVSYVLTIINNVNAIAENDMLLLSCLTSLDKVIGAQSAFLSSILKDILVTICTLKIPSYSISKTEIILTQLKLVQNKISTLMPLRVLLEKSLDSYEVLFCDQVGRFHNIDNLMNILLDAFKVASIQEINSLIKPFIALCVQSLSFRYDVFVEDEMSANSDNVDTVEDKIIETFASGVKKMSDLSFYGKLFVWANKNEHKTLTFYCLSAVVSEQLKSLFVPSAVRFLSNVADLLNKLNINKNSELMFNGNVKLCDKLIRKILKTMYEIFLNDGQNFINKERFDFLMPAIVNQLDNDFCDNNDRFMERNLNSVIPCIAQLVEASVNNAYWKQLNEQILLKTHHKNPLVRQSCLHCLCAIVKRISADFLPLLPESIRYLSELLEDDDENVEKICRKTIQELSDILGEPIEKYF